MNANIMGYYYKNNIHPYTECLNRQQTLETYSETIGLKMIFQEEYDLEGFLQKVIFRESKRCSICYHERLTTTAQIAKHGKFDCFSTTLLYSKFQKHDKIKLIGEAVGKSIGIPFYYYDFRTGWEVGIKESKRLDMYRQKYCGCIYSEKDRFYKDTHK